MAITELIHREGIWYHEAPLPRRLHFCKAWTTGYENYLSIIERCACGAIRYDRSIWVNRNERRKES